MTQIAVVPRLFMHTACMCLNLFVGLLNQSSRDVYPQYYHLNCSYIYIDKHSFYVYIHVLLMLRMYAYMYVSGWWFGTFFIFPYIGNNNPN